MIRRVHLLPLAALAACASTRDDPPPAERPNFILFLVDDMGWRDVGFMGHPSHRTPHMDRLAAGGMVFTDAYSNAPNCAPSRACLLTGQYVPRHGIHTVGARPRGQPEDRLLVPVPNRTDLPTESITLAEALRAAGYATAQIGKWHLGDDPLAHGFQQNVAGCARGHPPNGYFSPYEIPNLVDGPDGEYLTDRLTEEALAFLSGRDRREPFFLYLSHYGVHTPIQAREELTAAYLEPGQQGGEKRARYAAMVQSVDDSLGRLLEHLERTDQAERTVVILMSDNGGHGGVTSMAPLRGSKGMLFEGGIRVPLAVRWPGRVAEGGRSAIPVMGADLYPTILEAAAVGLPAGQPVDGESLWPILSGAGQLDRDALFFHFPSYLEAYRKGDSPWRTTPAGAIRVGDLKLIEFFEDGATHLFDLGVDPGEQVDLVTDRPGDARRLLARLRGWRQSVGARMPRSESNSP